MECSPFNTGLQILDFMQSAINLHGLNNMVTCYFVNHQCLYGTNEPAESFSIEGFSFVIVYVMIVVFAMSVEIISLTYFWYN